MVDLADSEFVLDLLPNPEKGMFVRFGRPAEPSDPKGSRCSRLWRDSRFHLQDSENEVTLLAMLQVSAIIYAKYRTHVRVFQLETSFSPG